MLALNPQTNQTLILSVFIYLIHFQIPCTSHCILISYIYVVENITLPEFILPIQYLQSCYKTSNRNMILCYIVKTYKGVKGNVMRTNVYHKYIKDLKLNITIDLDGFIY